MIGFSNLDSLICLCGARNRFGALAFAGDEGGRPAYTAEDLARAVKAVKITGDKNAEIKSLIADSRRVAPSSAFFAVNGFTTDGNAFVEEAAHRGAVAVISERPCPKYFPAAWIQVERMPEALSAAAKSFYANPDESLKTFGVTGTNGKTSVTWMLQAILNASGQKCGVITPYTTTSAEDVCPQAARPPTRSSCTRCSTRCATAPARPPRWKSARTP